MRRRFRNWLDDRTNYRQVFRFLRERRLPDGPKWGYSTATCLLWLLAIECLTGFLLMATYSPSATTAWASVHFIEQDTAGAFLRGVHYFAAQALIILFVIHVIRVLVTGAFRAPHEIVWATGLLIIPLLLAWAITGNPLSGSVRGMSQIEVEGNIIGSAPLVGPILQRLLIGGDQVGNLTLTHLYFLHVGLLPLLVLLLLAVHIWQIYRHGLASTGSRPTLDLAIPYWPYQTVRNMTVLAIVLGTVCSLAWAYGAPLDAPADPQISHTPRPEWYFLFLFELRRYFTGHWEFVATTLIPILVLLFLIVLPLVDRMCSRRVSAVLRFAVVLIGCGSWAALTVASVVRDRDDQELAASNTVLHELSVRARTLADHQSIPLEGPAALLRNDPKTQGPRLFSRHCASCHSFLDGEGHGIAAETPSAPNLYGFASREWISGLLDPDRIAGEHYFGNTAFAEGDMVSTIRAAFDSAADEDERDEILQDMRKAAVALSAEASLPRQNETDRRDTESIHQGRQLVSTTLGCTDCHRFREQGELGSAPDLTGYGSRDWLVSFIGNPSHARFYADRNDRMPLFAPNSEHPKKNLLPSRDVELLADWLRQDWYERDGTSENAAAPNPTSAPARRERQLADRD